MRNRITLIISLISIILLAFLTINGVRLGSFEILSISQIIAKNDDVNAKINEASKLTSVDYPEKIENLNKTFDNYNIQKRKYQELAGVSDKYSEDIYETKQYDISYLWRVLGKYATNRGLTLGINVQKSTNNLYNFSFSLNGTYVDIIQFISDIENDSDLYFRIYDFKMSGSGTSITSSFLVRDVNIDPSTIANSQSDVISDETDKQFNNTINIFNK